MRSKSRSEKRHEKRAEKVSSAGDFGSARRNARGSWGGKRRGLKIRRIKKHMCLAICGATKGDLEFVGEILDPKKEKRKIGRRILEKRREIWIGKKRKATVGAARRDLEIGDLAI